MPLYPSFGSARPTVKPGPFSTRTTLIPRCGGSASGSVLHSTAQSDGAHGLQVGAPTRLGERHRGAELAGRHSSEVLLLLLAGAVAAELAHDDRVAAHGAGQAHPAPRQLLDHGREAPYGDVAPTELGRNQQAEDAELLHRVDEVL